MNGPVGHLPGHHAAALPAGAHRGGPLPDHPPDRAPRPPALRQIDPAQRWNRALLSLLRRRADRLNPEQRQALDAYLQAQPAIAALYRFKQELWGLLRPRGLTPSACRPLIRELLDRIGQLKESPFAPRAALGQTLEDWQDEIARMWRFSRNNGITEGFRTKMEMISRRSFGFKNFDNYRLRVRACCG